MNNSGYVPVTEFLCFQFPKIDFRQIIGAESFSGTGGDMS